MKWTSIQVTGLKWLSAVVKLWNFKLLVLLSLDTKRIEAEYRKQWKLKIIRKETKSAYVVRHTKSSCSKLNWGILSKTDVTTSSLLYDTSSKLTISTIMKVKWMAVLISTHVIKIMTDEYGNEISKIRSSILSNKWSN